MSDKNELVENLYTTADVKRAVANSGGDGFGAWDEIPQDVFSDEFAAWLANHLSLALQNGIDSATSHLTQQLEQRVIETIEEYAASFEGCGVHLRGVIEAVREVFKADP